MDHVYDVTSNHRYQWVGIQDYPRTYTLSINGPTKDLKNGLGAFIYTDNVGPTRRTGAQASYAYHMNVTEDIEVSLSLSAGLIEWKIDGNQLTFNNPNEPASSGNVMRSLMPDANSDFCSIMISGILEELHLIYYRTKLNLVMFKSLMLEIS